MVGDRIYTDMKMARGAGVPAALVLTGETTASQAAALHHQPDLTVADVGQLGELLADAGRVTTLKRRALPRDWIRGRFEQVSLTAGECSGKVFTSTGHMIRSVLSINCKEHLVAIAKEYVW